MKSMVHLWVGPSAGPQPLGGFAAAVKPPFTESASVSSLTGTLLTEAESSFSKRLLKVFPGLFFIVSDALSAAPLTKQARQEVEAAVIARLQELEWMQG